ncbi:hypothetical protein [Paraburkholderia youngii]|uniref:Uncharacterized protein n=1 Tax=Paraburkholderia youngii TaxID=2782701 RepID=A0A7Y6K895_9BURK|nr:hypothetical protein [Paraburkholderia youngii]NUY05409.1 hypothetical protein [Paraburkholderia youngii]
MSRGFRSCVKDPLAHGFAANFHLSALSAGLPATAGSCCFLRLFVVVQGHSVFHALPHTSKKARSPDVHGNPKPRGFALVGFFSGVAVIQDVDTPGCRSVTNAAETVVAAALAVMDGPDPDVIVYGDSMGKFDGLLVGEEDCFAGYLPLGGARSHDEARARFPYSLAALRADVAYAQSWWCRLPARLAILRSPAEAGAWSIALIRDKPVLTTIYDCFGHLDFYCIFLLVQD